MAKTVTKRTMWHWASPDGVAPNKVVGRIAASQGVFMPGAPFYRDASGTWTRAATSDGTNDNVHGFCVGAVNAATTWPLTAEQAVNTAMYFEEVDPADTYACFVSKNAADAAATDALIGVDYGIDVDANAGTIGQTTMNTGDTTNVVVHVVDILSRVEPSKNTTSDSPGIALVRFFAAKSSEGVAS
jgi:hypothetical protein